jgi:hypothetical protein
MRVDTDHRYACVQAILASDGRHVAELMPIDELRDWVEDRMTGRTPAEVAKLFWPGTCRACDRPVVVVEGAGDLDYCVDHLCRNCGGGPAVATCVECDGRICESCKSDWTLGEGKPIGECCCEREIEWDFDLAAREVIR